MQFIRWNFYHRVMWWISYDPIISDFCIFLTSHWPINLQGTLLIGWILPFWTFWQLTCRQLCSHIKYLNENEFNIRKLYLLGDFYFFFSWYFSIIIMKQKCRDAFIIKVVILPTQPHSIRTVSAGMKYGFIHHHFWNISITQATMKSLYTGTSNFLCSVF